jgi:beta-lactamase superfamily II metal-dependent hydrolase
MSVVAWASSRNFGLAKSSTRASPYGGRAYAGCKRAAAQRHVPIRVVHRGFHWSTNDGEALDILAPTEVPLVDTGDDVNENSIVARLTYTRDRTPFAALFMGDAGMARESALLDHGIDLRADFLIFSKSVTTDRATLQRPHSPMP